jgi:hypothetical protein
MGQRGKDPGGVGSPGYGHRFPAGERRRICAGPSLPEIDILAAKTYWIEYFTPLSRKGYIDAAEVTYQVHEAESAVK